MDDSSTPYKCLICMTVFNNNGTLKKHMVTHTLDHPFACTVCLKTFKKYKSCENHIKRHYNKDSDELKISKFKAKNCSLPYINNFKPDNLNLSNNIETSINPINGDIIYTIDVSDIKLENEVQVLTTEQPNVVGQDCDKNIEMLNSIALNLDKIEDASYENQFNSSLYKVVGGAGDDKDAMGDFNERRYLCELCLKRFKKISHLKDHIRSHTGEKPFECSFPTCRLSFSTNGSLKRHMITHTGERPFSCPHCYKTFRRPGVCEIHMKKAHLSCGDEQENWDENNVGVSGGDSDRYRNKTFKCPQPFCNVRLSRKSTLKRHILLHAGKLPYNCSRCKKSFKTWSVKKRHYENNCKDPDFPSSLQPLPVTSYHASQRIGSSEDNFNNNLEYYVDNLEHGSPNKESLIIDHRINNFEYSNNRSIGKVLTENLDLIAAGIPGRVDSPLMNAASVMANLAYFNSDNSSSQNQLQEGANDNGQLFARDFDASLSRDAYNVTNYENNLVNSITTPTTLTNFTHKEESYPKMEEGEETESASSSYIDGGKNLNVFQMDVMVYDALIKKLGLSNFTLNADSYLTFEPKYESSKHECSVLLSRLPRFCSYFNVRALMNPKFNPNISNDIIFTGKSGDAIYNNNTNNITDYMAHVDTPKTSFSNSHDNEFTRVSLNCNERVNGNHFSACNPLSTTPIFVNDPFVSQRRDYPMIASDNKRGRPRKSLEEKQRTIRNRKSALKNKDHRHIRGKNLMLVSTEYVANNQLNVDISRSTAAQALIDIENPSLNPESDDARQKRAGDNVHFRKGNTGDDTTKPVKQKPDDSDYDDANEENDDPYIKVGITDPVIRKILKEDSDKWNRLYTLNYSSDIVNHVNISDNGEYSIKASNEDMNAKNSLTFNPYVPTNSSTTSTPLATYDYSTLNDFNFQASNGVDNQNPDISHSSQFDSLLNNNAITSRNRRNAPHYILCQGCGLRFGRKQREIFLRHLAEVHEIYDEEGMFQ
ncbi:unnamed protein product [Gordionus sp. m RMFG-2023]|uniref:uncharacterized protein LOC135925360 isoform X1 n=1 Tax=Gordionus sp. m RMFG-2023 TaxID=3053472 RepID=UPI0030E1F63E